MPRMRLTVLLATLAALACARGLAAQYFLSPNGDDRDAGTRDEPWMTIAHANATVVAGDTVTFLDGRYEGVLDLANSGEEGAPITYRSERRLGAVLTGGQSSDGATVCVRLIGREHVAIEGFHLLPTVGGWMKLTGCRYCVVRDCRMENATRSSSPIECRDCHYNRYENLECWRSNNLGAQGHVAGDLWNNFASSHNVFEGLHISRAGHRPFGLWLDCPYNVVRRCVFDCRWGRNFEFFSTPRLLMEECVVTNGFDGSGSADGRSKLFVIDSVFRRNLIYRNYYGPLVINSYKYHDEDPFALLRSRLYHNTWYRNHMYGFEMVDLGEHPDPHRVAGNILQNNVFAGNDPGGDGLALYLVSNIADDNLFRFNDLYGHRPGCKTVRYDWAWPGIERWEGLAMTAAEAEERRPEQFTRNLDVAPGFVDPEADDYRLRAGSPCVDAGGPLTVVRQSGAGRQMPVEDARWFYDGFGIPGEQGDLLFVSRDGAPPRQVKVVRADIERQVLTLDRELTWRKGDTVSLPCAGNAPDLGAYEQGAEGQPWYRACRVPEGLRAVTMETATDVVLATDFEAENLEEWHYYWNFSRQRNTDARLDDTTAASGKRSMRIFATDDGAVMACDVRPRWWDVDRFPFVELCYRLPPGVPLGLWLHAFPSARVGQGAVCVGGTAARDSGPYRDLDRYRLADDGEWHKVTIDARYIREVFPDVKLLQMFRFYTRGNGRKGQQYWFDAFAILPAASGERAPAGGRD